MLSAFRQKKQDKELKQKADESLQKKKRVETLLETGEYWYKHQTEAPVYNAFSLDERNEIRDSFAVALKLDPKNARANSGMGYVMLNNQSSYNAKAALDYFKEALKLDPSLKDAQDGAVMSLFLLMRYEEAIIFISKDHGFVSDFLRTDRHSYLINEACGKCFYNTANYEKAIEYFKRALYSLNSTSRKYQEGHLHDLVGWSLSNLGRDDEALAWYEEVQKRSPDLAKQKFSGKNYIRCKKAEVLISDKRYTEAQVIYDDILKEDPRFVDAHLGKAHILFSKEKWQELLAYSETIIGFSPVFGNAWKGVALINLQKYKEALIYYDKAFELDPNDINVLKGRSRALVHCSLYLEALECIEKIPVPKLDNDSLNTKSIILTSLERYEEALTICDEILKTNNDYAGAYASKGRIHLLSVDAESALVWFNKASEISPKQCDILNGKALALFNLHQYKNALDLFDEAIKLAPNNLTLSNNIANTLLQLGKYSQAVTFFDAALAHNPTSAQLGDFSKIQKMNSKYLLPAQGKEIAMTLLTKSLSETDKQVVTELKGLADLAPTNRVSTLRSTVDQKKSSSTLVFAKEALSPQRFYKAVYDNDLGEVKEMVEQKLVNVDQVIDKDNTTALHLATYHTDRLMLKFLLAKKAKPNVADVNGRTPLHWAAYSGSLLATNLLLKAGADPTVKDGDLCTAEQLAAVAGHEAIVKLLRNRSAKTLSTAEHKPATLNTSLTASKDDSRFKLLEEEFEQKLERQQLGIEQKLQLMLDEVRKSSEGHVKPEKQVIEEAIRRLQVQQETFLMKLVAPQAVEDELLDLKTGASQLQKEIDDLRLQAKKNPEVYKRLEDLEQKAQPLFAEYEERQQKLQTQQYILQHLPLRTFYNRVQVKLNRLFLAYMVISSGEVNRSADKTNTVITLLGKPLSYFTLGFGEIIVGSINALYNRKQKKQRTQITNDYVISITLVETMVERVARQLTLRYEEQIREATVPGQEGLISKISFDSSPNGGAETLAECAVMRMINALQCGAIRPDQELDKQLEESVFQDQSKHGTLSLTHQTIKTSNGKSWTDAGIFRHSGIKTFDGKWFIGKTKTCCDQAELYGYRWGTPEEARKLALAEQSCPTNTRSSISLATRKQVKEVTAAAISVEHKQDLQSQLLQREKTRADQLAQELENIKRRQAEEQEILRKKDEERDKKMELMQQQLEQLQAGVGVISNSKNSSGLATTASATTPLVNRKTQSSPTAATLGVSLSRGFGYAPSSQRMRSTTTAQKVAIKTPDLIPFRRG